VTAAERDELLTVQDVSTLTTISAPTLRKWRQLGRPPASFKLGQRTVYRKSAVDAWIAAQETTTTKGGQ
jgi:predicted DNA-binding transcriptional regulator AlpA